jgi:1-acyl-sn-glycerol-3-phosphate acyltransferase
MIPPKHARWAHALFRPYLRGLCKRRFHSIHLLGDVPVLPEGASVLLLPNHSSWWDGFFPYLLNEALLHRTFYIMMLEHRLREFWFFRKLGAYSINQQSPKAIAETLAFTAQLLSPQQHSGQHPASLVVMFPQGELRPWGMRPLGYNRGVEWLLKKSDTPVTMLPLAMRCELLNEEKPSVFLMCGTPRVETAASFDGVAALERDMERLLGDLERRIIDGERGVRLL